MSIMFPDKIKVYNNTLDSTYGNISSQSTYTTKAYVEYEDVVKRDSQGNALGPRRVIFIPEGLTINVGDYIEILKIKGRTPTTLEAIKREVVQTIPAGGMKESHIELEVRSTNA